MSFVPLILILLLVYLFLIRPQQKRVNAERAERKTRLTGLPFVPLILILLAVLLMALGLNIVVGLALLVFLLVHIFGISPQQKREKAERAESQARRRSRSPSDKYHEAITAELSPGEQLLAACECYTFSLVGKKEKATQMQWFILVLTNINLRKMLWRKGSIPELAGMETFPISDVASHQYLAAKPAKEIRKRLVRSFGN